MIAAIADTVVVVLVGLVWLVIGVVLVNRLSGYPKDSQ